MTYIIGPAAAGKSADMSEFMLKVLRCGSLRAKLLGNEIDVIGTALKNNFISPDDAIAALDDIDGWHLIPEISREGVGNG